MAKRNNPYKESLYRRFGNLMTEEIWKSSMSLAKQFIGGRKNVLHEKYSSIASYLASEKIMQERFGEASFFSRYENATGTKTERFRQALNEEYYDRTLNFRTKYSEVKISYNSINLDSPQLYFLLQHEIISKEDLKTMEFTLSQWYEMFNLGFISKDEMNEIIEMVKDNIDSQIKGDYNGTPQNEDTASHGFYK